MACLKVMNAAGVIRVLPEDPRDRNVRGMFRDERIIGVDYKCGPVDGSDLDSIITADGLMVGNLIKRITSAVGIKQCLACKGRQRNYNNKGLEIQRKVKRAILRS